MNFRNVLRRTGLPGLLPVDALASLSGQNFILPFYHIVSNADCPHIKNLYRVKTEKEFEADLDFLLKHYQPIEANDLNDALAGKFRNKKTFLLTFDDGLRECHDVIAPILLRKGIPAIFFLNSDFIDNKALMFRYKVSLLIEQLKGDNIGLAQRLKAERTDSSVIAETASQLNYSFDTFLKTQQPYLTSAQVQSLISKGFTMGAHSCNHPYYEDISLQEQLRQTFDSLKFIQQQFGVKEKLFAFPFTDFGVKHEFFNTIFSQQQIDFSFGGAGFKHDVSPRHLQRLAMEQSIGAEEIIRTEYLYYLLKMPLMKNTIARS
ncbi:MAG TPA: polysaccharide deacetylase family protein [Chitinophagales bacterium]|nr:polysaccharide deacetylase family protein [Chitinophagales bacterium]